VGSVDKEADFKPWLIFCSKGCIWELAPKFLLKGRRESDNKGRVIGWKPWLIGHLSRN
jgi:hypothetical protein